MLASAGLATGGLAFIGAGAAYGSDTDVTEAEGQVITFSGGTIDLDQVAEILPAYSATPSATGEVSSPLTVQLLSGIDLGLGNGVQLFTDGTTDGVLGVGALGQYASTTSERAYASSGAVGDAGVISWGGTDPSDSAYLDLGNLLGIVGSEIGIEDLVETVISDLRLDLGAISASAEKTPGADPVGDYQIADGRLVITSPAVGGIADGLDEVAAQLSTTLNGVLGEDGALNQGLDGITDDIIAPIADALAGIPLIGDAVTISNVGVNASVDVDLSEALAPLLQEQLTSDDSALTIDLSEGTISVDLAKLIADTQGGDYDGTLNDLPVNTELLSPDLVQAILDGTAGTLLDEIPGRALDLVTAALNATAVNISITGTISALAGLVTGNLDVQLSGELGQLLDPDAEPLDIDTSGTNIVISDGLPITPDIVLPIGDIAEALVTPITATVLPLIGGVLQDVISDVGITDTVFRVPVEAANALLSPLVDVLTGIVSLTANVQEQPGAFTTETASSDGSFTQRALNLSLLPVLSSGPVVDLSLASATVRADEIVYEPTITVTPDTAEPGDSVTIDGDGFAPNETVTIEITDEGGDVVDTIMVETDENGGFTTDWTVPGDIDPGTLTVTAEGDESQVPATDEVTIANDSESETDSDATTDANANANASASAAASASADDDSNASAQAAAQAAANADASSNASAASSADATAAAQAAANADASSEASADVSSDANASAASAAQAAANADASSAANADASAAAEGNASAAASSAANADSSSDASSEAAADAAANGDDSTAADANANASASAAASASADDDSNASAQAAAQAAANADASSNASAASSADATAAAQSAANADASSEASADVSSDANASAASAAQAAANADASSAANADASAAAEGNASAAASSAANADSSSDASSEAAADVNGESDSNSATAADASADSDSDSADSDSTSTADANASSESDTDATSTADAASGSDADSASAADSNTASSSDSTSASDSNGDSDSDDTAAAAQATANADSASAADSASDSDGTSDAGSTASADASSDSDAASASSANASSDADGTQGIWMELAHDRLTHGETQIAYGHGFQPGEKVTATMYSTPLSLGSDVADENGDVSYTWSIPASSAVGDHRVELVGAESGAVDDTFEVYTTASQKNSLTPTGGDMTALAGGLALTMLLSGAAIWLVARRRGTRV